MEAALWEAANKLRGNVEPAEYKHVVLSLIFLKYASDKFEERRQELIDDGKGAYVDMVDFYTMKSVFYIPETSRWSYIMEQSKQADIALKIDTALYKTLLLYRTLTLRCKNDIIIFIKRRERGILCTFQNISK